MDVKVIRILNNQETFENEIKKYMEQGYKVHSTTIIPNTMGFKTSLNIIEQKILYYALLIKEF